MSTLGIGPVRGDAASLQKQLVSNFIVYYFWLSGTISPIENVQMHGFDTKWMTLNLKGTQRHGKQCYWILI